MMPSTSPILGLPIAAGSDPAKQFPTAVDSPRTLALETHVVARFASAAARDAAIPAPVAGQMCYLADTGTTQMYNGFVWVGDTAWRTATYLNGWATVSGGTNLRVGQDGTVHLTVGASATNPTSSSFASIPSSCSPPATIHFAATISEGGAFKIARASLSSAGALSFVGHAVIGSVTQINGYIGYRANFLAVR